MAEWLTAATNRDDEKENQNDKTAMTHRNETGWPVDKITDVAYTSNHKSARKKTIKLNKLPFNTRRKID